MTELPPEARAMKNAASREYYRNHPEKRREKQIRYWNRKAEKAAAAVGTDFEIAEARQLDTEQKARLLELTETRNQTEQRSDLSPEARAAKEKVIEREISAIKSDARRR